MVTAERQHTFDPTQNSDARMSTDALGMAIARRIPFDPDNITRGGLWLSEFGITYLEDQNRMVQAGTGSRNKLGTGVAIAAVVAGKLCDWLDGKRARVYIEQGWLHNSENGANLDTFTDREREKKEAEERAKTAEAREDWFGSFAARAVIATSPLTSLARNFVETHGYAVPESGNLKKTIGHLVAGEWQQAVVESIQFFGSSYGRNFAVVSTLFPRIQPYADAFFAINNITNAGLRIGHLINRDTEPLDAAQVEKAAKKSQVVLQSAIEAISGIFRPL